MALNLLVFRFKRLNPIVSSPAKAAIHFQTVFEHRARNQPGVRKVQRRQALEDRPVRRIAEDRFG
jgi:hypothetical protein